MSPNLVIERAWKSSATSRKRGADKWRGTVAGDPIHKERKQPCSHNIHHFDSEDKNLLHTTLLRWCSCPLAQDFCEFIQSSKSANYVAGIPLQEENTFPEIRKPPCTIYTDLATGLRQEPSSYP